MSASKDSAVRIASLEISALERETEVTRVLGSFKLNPFQILAIHSKATPKDISRKFRRLSLLCHPDKAKGDSQRERAEKAFALLSRSQKILLDEEQMLVMRELLDQAHKKVVYVYILYLFHVILVCVWY